MRRALSLWEPKTLVGLEALYVLIEPLPPQAEADGLHESEIRTEVEMKLRQAGIELLTRADWYSIAGSSLLYVRVTAPDSTAATPYLYTVEIGVQQAPRLDRDPSTGTRSSRPPTWSVWDVLGGAGLATIRDEIKSQVDQFINAWLSVNPRQ